MARKRQPKAAYRTSDDAVILVSGW
jgi:hypothetical protein